MGIGLPLVILGILLVVASLIAVLRYRLVTGAVLLAAGLGIGVMGNKYLG